MNGHNQAAHMIPSLGLNMQAPFSNKIMHHPFMKALGAGPGSRALEDHAAAVLGVAQIAGMNKTQLPSGGPGNNIVRLSVEEATVGHLMSTKPTQLISLLRNCS